MTSAPNLVINARMDIVHLYVAEGHNYFGHHGQPPGEYPIREVPRLECLAGQGVRGDRFFNHKADYKGQITFFAIEVYDSLCQLFQVWDKSPAVFRRNVLTRGLNLRDLIGKEFELGGVRFAGVEHCKPCYWMDLAFHPGAEDALRGQGGLRARILTDGTLKTGPATIER